MARRELAADRSGGHPLGDRREHLDAAIEWLCRAQDVNGDGGFARGYAVAWHPYFRERGWQRSYPETTGYIVPTLLEAARDLSRPELAERALRGAVWEADVQLESGAVQGGVIGEGRTPAVFNTGQVLLGWVAAWEATADARFADASRRAGRWLVEQQEPSGLWVKGNSRFALTEPTLYNARVAWALAETGVAVGERAFVDAAHRCLCAVAARVTANGWIPDCCLTDPDHPLVHTLAYAVRGLIEGGRVVGDRDVQNAGMRTARAIAGLVRDDGGLSGRYDASWRPAASWSCLTGNLQMCNNWMRLSLFTGDASWLEPVDRVMDFVLRTQNRSSSDPGLRGGIKGSFPIDGEYGRFETLNWATKFAVDAIVRRRQIAEGRAEERAITYRLA